MTNLNSNLCHSALTLNNLAVELLSRNCYDDAKQTLLDALQTVKVLLRQPLHAVNNICSFQDELIAHTSIRLQQAFIRMRNPNVQNEIPFQLIIINESMYSNVVSNEMTKACEMNCVRAFRINSDFNLEFGQNIELVFATILQNLGATYYCLFLNEDCDEKADNILCAAKQLFGLSEQVVNNLIARPEELDTMFNASLVMVCVLRNLSQVMFDLGHHMNSDQVRTKLQAILQNVVRLSELQALSNGSNFAAAA